MLEPLLDGMVQQLEAHVSKSILHALGVHAQAGERVLITSDPLNMALVCNVQMRHADWLCLTCTNRQ
jgi:hypothetical protein